MFLKRRSFKRLHAAGRKRKVLAFAGALVVLLVAAGIGSLAWASALPEVTVRNIIVEGAVSVSENDIQEHVRDALEGRYAGLFARSNIFLVRAGALEAGILDSFKEIKTVSVSRETPNTLRISMTERKPCYVWCVSVPGAGAERVDDDEGDAPGSGCYFLDLDGYVFTRAPSFSGNAYFKFYGSLGDAVATSSPSWPVGEYFLPGDDFERVVMFKNSLRNAGLVPYAFIADGGEYSLLLPGGGRLIFRQSQDFDILFDNIDATLDTEPFKKRIKNDTISSLEYIDMRFPDKVYYRFR